MLRLRNMAQRTCAPTSLSEKYQWPEAGRARLEISPSTHSSGKPRSRAWRMSLLSWVGVRITRDSAFMEAVYRSGRGGQSAPRVADYTRRLREKSASV